MIERERIAALLRQSAVPLTGGLLAERIGVSRQAVVQAIAVLRAGGSPIFATSRGYLWGSPAARQEHSAIFMVRHRPEQTQAELYALVDAGLTVVDVLIEHPVYGELQGGLDLRSRADVEEFLLKTRDHGGGLLSTLTQGMHWHTVRGRDERALMRGQEALQALGMWVEAGGVSSSSAGAGFRR
ncbi:MAG: transcription repressor NadR [Thermaerobacter sp.]|nr:transcription repressor NadR [Thermaerobacter sp.]